MLILWNQTMVDSMALDIVNHAGMSSLSLSRIPGKARRPQAVALALLLFVPCAFASSDGAVSDTISKDLDGDGTADHLRVTTFGYSAQGRVTSREVAIDSDADGTPDERHRYSYWYDGEGRLVRWLHGRDGDADGKTDEWQGKEWTRSDSQTAYRKWKGGPKDGSRPDEAEGWDRYQYIDENDGTWNISRITWYDRNGDGAPNLRLARQQHYDPQTGRLVEKNFGRDTDGSAPWEYFVRRYYSYSIDGNAYDYVSDVIRDGVSLPGPWGGAEAFYDSMGNVTDESWWKGIDDGAESFIRNWYEYEYDDKGRIVYKTKSENLLGPPQAERWNEWKRSYHANGRLKEVVNTGWWNKVIDRTNEINWTNRTTYHEDGSPRSISRVTSNIVEETRESYRKTFDYDGEGRLQGWEERRSKRLDGKTQHRKKQSISRDSLGRVVELRTAEDSDADGQDDRVVLRTRGY